MANNFPPLVERINQEGKSLKGEILKVDSFLTSYPC